MPAPFPQHPASLSRSRPARSGLWQGVFILVPLVLLALLGSRGIQSSRQAALERARQLVQPGVATLFQTVSKLLSDTLDEQGTPVFSLTPIPSVPPAPSADDPLQAYERALTAPPGAARALLDELLQTVTSEVTEAGLPLRPLLAWQRLRLEPGDSPDSLRRLAALTVQSTLQHPSALTPEIIARCESLLHERGLPGDFSAPLLRWRQAEQAILAYEQHRAQIAQGPLPLWIGEPGALFLVGHHSRDRSLRLLPREALTAALTPSLAAGARHLLSPHRLEFQIFFQGVPLVSPAPGGEILARQEADGLSLLCLLPAANTLYREQERQAAWLLALLACAVAAVLMSFWTMRRGWERERQLSELKSDFVSSVSHELRAPVASMRLLAENLQAGAVPGAERQREYHRLIGEECRRLSDLIENVLNFARIERDMRVYHFAETDVVTLIHEAAELMRPRAAQRRQILQEELAPLDPPPTCDDLAIRQALINLLDNAIKFAPENSAITVRLRPAAPGRWELSVSDIGPGIPRAEHARIFERFYRLGSELRRETQGTGIGLSIVQHIAHGHGGTVHVESQPGAGSTFTLALPLLPPGAQEEDPA